MASDSANHSKDYDNSNGEEVIAACQGCRRRKLKCDRQLPACSQCVRLSCECLYEHKKQKPGLKSGAVDSLNRRVEALEKLVRASSDPAIVQPSHEASTGHQNCLYEASVLLVKELRRLGNGSGQGISPNQAQYVQRSPLSGYDPTNQHDSIILQTAHQDNRFSRKRKRPETDVHNDFLNSDEIPLPFPHMLQEVIDVYFDVVQHWIPFLHKTRFLSRMADPEERPKLEILLHAIISVSLRLIDTDVLEILQAEIDQKIQASRNYVLLKSMDSLSIENLQSLIIIAFDHMTSSRVSKSWSIVGSLTRTVGYLQLSVEPLDDKTSSLLRPLTLLQPTKSWVEAEERRRVFWNIFLLDRFCSITTGWDTSLTSDDVHRQLPTDGGLWHKGEAVGSTPYFGIWNKSAAKIGNSIAYIPAHLPSPNNKEEWSPGTTESTHIDTSKLGAFAYCIEATEGLSQVTSFFLQQKVNFSIRSEIGSWLTRFKELDLRLVHWKMFLPHNFQDSNISREPSLIEMDPNLTLAHITHNTSMILLHQHIAFPLPEWSKVVKLPSSCSAETCLMAAVETANISQKYLKYRERGIVNSQFAFCAFVAARVLLLCWCLKDDSNLAPEFFSLGDSLREMSRRWSGPVQLRRHQGNIDQTDCNIAGSYALQLRQLHQRCLGDPNFKYNILAYLRMLSDQGRGLLPLSETPLFMNIEQADDENPRMYANSRAYNIGQSFSPLQQQQQQQTQSQEMRHSPTMAHHSNVHPGAGWASQQYVSAASPGSSSLSGSGNMLPPPPSHMGVVETANGSLNMNYGGGGGEMADDELSAMSHVLLGQQFMEMDRVITLDGTDFAIDLSSWQNI